MQQNLTATTSDGVLSSIKEPRITVLALSEEENVGKEVLLGSWEIESLTSSLLRIQLYFPNPLYVSQGDTADILIVIVELGEFKDIYGQKLPDSVLLKVLLPP